jgi:hypothetical protein
MSTPYAFTGFPGQSVYKSLSIEFDRQTDLALFDWNGTGHVLPDEIGDYDGGGIVLGSGSAGASDYIQAQKVGGSVVMDRLNKTYEFIFDVQLSSATLARAFVGLASVNTNVLGTNITDGFGFFANLSGGPAAGSWYAMLAKDSAVQFTNYSQYQGETCDTSKHTLAIRIITDASVLGAGRVQYFFDGEQMGAGFTSSDTAIFPITALRPVVALGNGSAVAQTMIVREISTSGKR